MSLAPIILFVYNRPSHTKDAIEALKKNDIAGESELFIFSDYPKNNKAKMEVEKVRRYIRTITGFKSITAIERNVNFGLSASVISGVTEVVKKYGKVIVMEDDLITSPFFLGYMNDALLFYENNEKVVSICGYMYPVKNKLQETVLFRIPDCWGWATWERGWDLFEQDANKLLDSLKARGLTRQFDLDGAYGFTRMLEKQARGKVDSWAIRWYASSFLKGKLSLYPHKSLVNNIGHDSSGINCRLNRAYGVNVSQNRVSVENITLEEDKLALDQIRSFFRGLRPGIFNLITKQA